eukprot:CAMPEP_0170771110 /NCGR_PEP_ID=MMETSP0733-20121128/7865_1 /TAXON_ID=186038 /ORGANISM="Fragilariopsis kerguelensis, Strain L26-C5" /LENGTH=52 /DNA_ID=CAMNT_0011112809 /DNA_START=318 /DNA_END=476 /DNA_ORIENTATION=+
MIGTTEGMGCEADADADADACPQYPTSPLPPTPPHDDADGTTISLSNKLKRK